MDGILKMSVLDDKERRHYLAGIHLRMSIAFQVRWIRIQRGLKQEDLAKLAGTKQSGIARIENWNSKKFPNHKTLMKIASALDCALEVRFEDWERMKQMVCEPFDTDKKL